MKEEMEHIAVELGDIRHRLEAVLSQVVKLESAFSHMAYALGQVRSEQEKGKGGHDDRAGSA